MMIVYMVLAIFLTMEFIKDGCDLYFHTHIMPKIFAFVSASSKIVLVYVLISQNPSSNTTTWYALWTIVSILILMFLYTVKVVSERNVEEEKELLVSSV